MGWCHWWLMLNADANLRFENLTILWPLVFSGQFSSLSLFVLRKTHACTHFCFLAVIDCFYSLNMVCCPFWEQVLFAALSHVCFSFLLSCLCNLFFPPWCSFSLLFRFLHSHVRQSSSGTDWEEKSKKPTLPLGLTSFDDEEPQEGWRGVVVEEPLGLAALAHLMCFFFFG